MGSIKICTILFLGIAIAAWGGQNAKAAAACPNLIGDLNHDCRVDWEDFALMAFNWLVDCNQDPTNPACNGGLPFSTITAVADSNGSIDPNGNVIINYGQDLTLTATPASGYGVDTWTLDGVAAQIGSDIFTLFNITTDHTVAVSFKVLITTPTITAVSDSNGSIDPNGGVIINYGQDLTLTATPASGYGVDRWTLDGVEVQSGGDTFTLPNITTDHTVAVSFKVLITTPTITAVADSNGSIDPNGNVIINYGQDLNLTATPAEGYGVDRWTLDGVEAQIGGYTFTLPHITTNHTVAVSFKVLITTPPANVIIAASNSSDNDKAVANFVCFGTNDDDTINAVIRSTNNTGGGIIQLQAGTYKIKSRIWFQDGTANIVFRGSGPSTIFEKQTDNGTMSGAPVADVDFSTVIATTGVFNSSMVGQIIQFDTSNMTYQIKRYISPTEIQIGTYSFSYFLAGGTNDASRETPGDTFRIGNVYHVIHQQMHGHHLTFQDFQIDGKNFGYNRYAGNKGLFINGDPCDYSQCHDIYIERVIAKNTTAEAICIDYSQYAYIQDCQTENSAWAGITLAQVKNGSIQNCSVYKSGTANITISLGAGVNCQNVENGQIVGNYISGANDIALAVATQELQANLYPSQYVTVKNNTIVDTNIIANLMVIRVDCTQGTPGDVVLNNYIDIIGNSINGDIGSYHGIFINYSSHVNVLGNNINALGRNSVGKYGIYYGDHVDDVYYNENSISSSYTPPVQTNLHATNIRAGTNYIVP